MTVKILGISGSLREASFNSALLRAAAELMPPEAVLEIGTIRGIPLYDGDVEASAGLPEPVVRLKEQIAAADGLLLATPEYNNSIPGVFKNAIDWASRPASDIGKVFTGRPVALMGASPGGFGTILSQNAWLPVLHTLGMRLWSDSRIMVSRASAAFDATGHLHDDQIRERLATFLAAFTGHVRRHTLTSGRDSPPDPA